MTFLEVVACLGIISAYAIGFCFGRLAESWKSNPKKTDIIKEHLLKEVRSLIIKKES